MTHFDINMVNTENALIAAASSALTSLDLQILNQLEDLLNGWAIDGETKETLNGMINAMQDAVEENRNS